MDQWKKDDMKESRYGGIKGGMRVEVQHWKKDDMKESGYGGEKRERTAEVEERREKRQ